MVSQCHLGAGIACYLLGRASYRGASGSSDRLYRGLSSLPECASRGTVGFRRPKSGQPVQSAGHGRQADKQQLCLGSASYAIVVRLVARHESLQMSSSRVKLQEMAPSHPSVFPCFLYLLICTTRLADMPAIVVNWLHAPGVHRSSLAPRHVRTHCPLFVLVRAKGFGRPGSP